MLRSEMTPFCILANSSGVRPVASTKLIQRLFSRSRRPESVRRTAPDQLRELAPLPCRTILCGRFPSFCLVASGSCCSGRGHTICFWRGGAACRRWRGPEGLCPSCHRSRRNLIDASGEISESVPINGEIVPIADTPGPCPRRSSETCFAPPCHVKGARPGLYALCTLKGGRRT